MGLDIASIKQLRDRTGAGMSDCKKALEEANGNIDLACDILREKGIIKASKKGGRIAAEGTTYVYANGNDGIIVEVNSETDFVGKSDAFKSFVAEVANVILTNKPATLEAAKDLTAQLFTDATVKIGEKLDLRRFEIVTKTEEQSFGTYIHMGGKIGVLALFEGHEPTVSHGVTMHIAGNNPQYVSINDIPADVVAHETAIQLEASKTDPKLAGKPAHILENIIKGISDKIFGLVVLCRETRNHLYVISGSQALIGNRQGLLAQRILIISRYGDCLVIQGHLFGSASNNNGQNAALKLQHLPLNKLHTRKIGGSDEDLRRLRRASGVGIYTAAQQYKSRSKGEDRQDDQKQLYLCVFHILPFFLLFQKKIHLRARRTAFTVRQAR